MFRRPAAVTDHTSIPSWSTLFTELDVAHDRQVLPPEQDPLKRFVRYPVNEQLNGIVKIWSGDMTRLAVDAIVNAANHSLLGGGGIDGAIHSAAGSALVAECRKLGGCETGDCKITAGYALPAKHVLHTVGPICRGSNRRCVEGGSDYSDLASCYRRCLVVAMENNLHSVCFCCVSTGIYGYPPEFAVHCALKTVREWLESDESHAAQFESIIFCTFLASDERLYKQWAPYYFPVIPVEEVAVEPAVAEAAAVAAVSEFPPTPMPMADSSMQSQFDDDGGAAGSGSAAAADVDMDGGEAEEEDEEMEELARIHVPQRPLSPSTPPPPAPTVPPADE